jgi:hypothetical protein
MSFIGKLVRNISERNARGKSYADLQRALLKTGETVRGRFAMSGDTPAHREAGQHIIGIESWGQSRLRVGLGEPLLNDEYDGYRPDAGMDLPALTQSFAETRTETVEIAKELESAGVSLSETVPHNQLGDLTIGGWLSYLIAHAGRESRRL